MPKPPEPPSERRSPSPVPPLPGEPPEPLAEPVEEPLAVQAEAGRPEGALRQLLHRVPWGALIGIVLFGLALFALHHQLKTYRYEEVRDSFRAIPVGRLALAMALTLLNYVVLTGYDTLGFRYIRHPLPYPKIALASFIGYAFSNNIGLSAVSGASVRYRFYTGWGMQPSEIAHVVAFYLTTLWLGLFTVAGALFVTWPLPLPESLHLPFRTLSAPGALLLGIVLAYVVLVLVRRGRALKMGPVSVPIPGLPLAVGQLTVSALDWAVAGLVLYALVPGSPMPLGHFLAVYLLAQVAGLASQVPGGLGIFETIMLALAGSQIPGHDLVGALLAYRLVYFLVPLLLATLLLGAHEAVTRRESLARVAGTVRARAETWGPEIVPRLLAVATFACGVMLLASGATPTSADRLRLLEGVVPLPLVEVAHFVASVAGFGLLLLARGIQLRLVGAWRTSLALLAVGVVASVLKGAQVEQALVLLALLVALWPCRGAFYRHARLASELFPARWIAAIAVAVGASVWLGTFAFKHVPYTDELWWRFRLFEGDAPRFLRATVGVLVAALLFALYKILRPAPLHALPRRVAHDEELARAHAVIRRSPRTEANLALLGDKRLLFDEHDTAFVQYGVQGRAFVSMGDPVAVSGELGDMIWEFHEWVEHQGGFAVFFDVPPSSLPYYLDRGLNVLKVGEAALVPLEHFSLDGPERAALRARLRAVEEAGCTFALVPPEEVPPLLGELRRVSDAWLRAKRTREMGFNQGFFSEEYLRQFPLAVVRRAGRIVAFANVWLSDGRAELAPDLLRSDPSAPEGVLEFLVTHLLRWGQARGYRRCNLGMAPVAGAPDRQLAPVWAHVSPLLFRQREHFVDLPELRAHKEAFAPQWAPRYVAYAGGALRAPVLLANVASLIAGGPHPLPLH